MEMNTAFMGMNGFVWWMGVVEDRKDPLGLGRCRVRIFGWHTENKVLIPTEDLPWAQVMLPVNSATQIKTPFEADWVVGFFLDGSSGQVPMIMGVVPGIPLPYVNNPQRGFCDPNGIYPKVIGEPSTSRLYRNEKIDSTTPVGKRNAAQVTGISTAGGSSWSEPKSSYNALHPYNEVKHTESGHVMEFDDTPKSERINLQHKSGTYIEMRPDGTQVTKVVGDNYEVVVGSDYVYVKGSCNITVDGTVNLLASGAINSKAPSWNHTGPVNIVGDVTVTGQITASGDVIGAGISLDTHVHSGVQGGPSNTGGPQ